MPAAEKEGHSAAAAFTEGGREAEATNGQEILRGATNSSLGAQKQGQWI